MCITNLPGLFCYNLCLPLFSGVVLLLQCVGMCLEKVPPSSTSKYKQAEWEEQMLQCYQTGGDLALLYLQDADKLNQQGTMATSGKFSPIWG